MSDSNNKVSGCRPISSPAFVSSSTSGAFPTRVESYIFFSSSFRSRRTLSKPQLLDGRHFQAPSPEIYAPPEGRQAANLPELDRDVCIDHT